MADDALNQSELGFLKDQLLLVPALGTALAIAYDVGYFNGVDISFFTLFSILSDRLDRRHDHYDRSLLVGRLEFRYGNSFRNFGRRIL